MNQFFLPNELLSRGAAPDFFFFDLSILNNAKDDLFFYRDLFSLPLQLWVAMGKVRWKTWKTKNAFMHSKTNTKNCFSKNPFV